MNAGALVCAGLEDAPAIDAPVLPWSTSFEDDGFCDYVRAGGFCYSDAEGSYEIVGSPVRSGSAAAAFTVRTGEDRDGGQARCVIQGVFPESAYYSAWYFLPSPTTHDGNWNLFHFQGGEIPSPEDHWDVSIAAPADDEPRLYVFTRLTRGGIPAPTDTVPVPIGRWFQVELYLRRAADETGAIALYQDGELLLERTELVTDPTTWGQWYVGNLADALTPPLSTVYVDDVTIRVSR